MLKFNMICVFWINFFMLKFNMICVFWIVLMYWLKKIIDIHFDTKKLFEKQPL
jgi:hypothetical protein